MFNDCFFFAIHHGYFKNDHFGIDDLIVICVFVSLTLITLSMFTYLDFYRYKLIDKHFGKVTDEDKHMAQNLLESIDVLNQTEYHFLEHPRFQEYEYGCITVLKQISKGHKVYKELITTCLEIHETIKHLSEEEKKMHESYHAYLDRLVALLLRNQSEI